MRPQESKQTRPRPSSDSSLGPLGKAARFFINAGNLRQIPRLVYEGPAPLVRLVKQIHNTSHIITRLEEGDPVHFVTSFPRSGNNWLRYLLADVLLQQQGIQTSTELPVHPDEMVPDFYCHWISGKKEKTPPVGLLVKTHQTFDELKQRYGGTKRVKSGGIPGLAPFRGSKFIYLYRTPEDALVSFYHFAARSKQLQASNTGGIDACCLARLGEWEENISSYLRAADEGAAVLFVPYELLLAYPTEIFSKTLRWLGIKSDTVNVERAVSNMEFPKLQAMEVRSRLEEDSRSKFNPLSFLQLQGKDAVAAQPPTAQVEGFIQERRSHLHFRLGGKGGGRSELQAATLAEIEDRTAHLLERANHRVMTQQSLPGSPATSKTGQIRIAAALHRKGT